MNHLNLNKAFFLLILLLAFILRFYKLGEVPLSLDWDEVSNAYNAYSILKTGKDEYGNFLPLTNRSFDDYKPPIYMYLNVPAISLFGLNEFSARLPSALFGFLTVPFVYLLVKNLFKKESVALVSMLFIAISPWHLQFSRVGFEANIGLFLTTASITLFLYSLKNHKIFPLPAALFGLSFYSYHSQRVFIPLILITLFFLFKKEIFSIPKKNVISFLAILLFLTGPLFLLTPQKALFGRFQAASSEENRKDIEKSISLVIEDNKTFISRLIHNRRVIISQRYLGNYVSYFDLNYIFTKGDDNFRHHIEGMGMLYFYQLPLLLIGIYIFIFASLKSSAFMLRMKAKEYTLLQQGSLNLRKTPALKPEKFIKNKEKPFKLILLWLLIAPIAAIPATPNPHAVRSLQMLIPLTVISAYASVWIFEKKIIFFEFTRNKLSYKNILLLSSAITVFVFLILYLHNYYSHYLFDHSSFWQYGYKEAVLESKKLDNKFARILVDGTLEQAYIYWLFYNQFDPNTYQQTGSKENFGKYFFQSKKPTNSNELFISAHENFPQELVIDKTIYNNDGSVAIRIGHPK